MPAYTANYSFALPVVGGDANIWGALLNDNWSDVDTTLKAQADAIDTKVPSSELADLVTSIIYPVNSVKITTDDVNPETYLPNTTWVRMAEGRAIVGVGTADGVDWTEGIELGAALHTLTEAELPAHHHNVNPPSTNTNTTGNHTHAIRPTSEGSTGGGSGSDWAAGAGTGLNTTSNGAHSHSVNIPAFDSANTGGGDAHNNIQPSIAVYIWKRTA